MRRLKWTGHVTLWGRGGVHTGVWGGDLRDRDTLEDLGIDGRTTLKWILKEIGWTDVHWLDLIQDMNGGLL